MYLQLFVGGYAYVINKANPFLINAGVFVSGYAYVINKATLSLIDAGNVFLPA